MTATGIVRERHAEGRAPSDAGTVIAAREINVVTLAFLEGFIKVSFSNGPVYQRKFKSSAKNKEER
jgi:hypothetical protein